jgi:membrane protein involved in colicin uptake
MSKLDKDSVIEKFTNAFTLANGKAPVIEAKGGWYSVDGGKNIRLAQLDEMADEMTTATAPADKKAVKEKAPAAVKSDTKKAAPAKNKPAAKKAATFSVKDFYVQQIQAVNPSSRAPR